MNGQNLYRPAPRDNPDLRLLCFPFAGGGGASYRLWPRHLPENIEVIAIHPPGRAHRLRESPLTRISAMVQSALDDLAPWIDRPIALFGHSLGAVVATECARVLEAQGRKPVHLFVSSRPPQRRAEELIHRLPNDEFIAAMNRRYRGIPDEILEHEDLLELLLPPLRADLEALETFALDPQRSKILSPTTVFGGDLDAAAPPADLEAWRDEVAGPCRIRIFPGDHFYLEPQRLDLLADIAATLTPLIGAEERRDAAVR